MFRAFFANNWANETWALPVAPSAGSTAATGTITVTTAPTDAGTIDLFIAGYHVATNVGATFTVNQVATAIHDAIMDSDMQQVLPVTATVPVAAVVTLTAKWPGLSGNDITLTANYYGRIGGEEMPPGLGLAFSNPVAGSLPPMGMMGGGAGTPSFTNAIANMGENEFEYVALPFTDSTTLLAWEQEYGFADTGRWGWMRQLYGHLFSAKRDIYSNLVTFGLTRNGKVTSILALEPTSPSPVYEWTAAYTGKAARALINDPARPLQTLHMETILPAPHQDRWNLQELNTFSTSGLATQRTLSDNVPMIARETTTYQLNLYGFGDDAFELVTTLATLAKLIRNQRHAITTKFPRHKLADDGTRFGAGQAIVTPKIIKAELVAEYRIDEFNGLVENAQAFKAHLIVERDANDPNRVNVLYPPDLVNQLRVFAVLNQFRLQYDRGIDEAIITTGGLITGAGAGLG
jgi:phage tail sheath gpL-like